MVSKSTTDAMATRSPAPGRAKPPLAHGRDVFALLQTNVTTTGSVTFGLAAVGVLGVAFVLLRWYAGD
jgi:hypothetical protein